MSRLVEVLSAIDPVTLESEAEEEGSLHLALSDYLTKALGRGVGLNADWVNPTWHLGTGRANHTDGEPYLFEEDEDGEYSLCVQRVDDEEGSSTPEELAVFRGGVFGPDGLLHWAIGVLKSLS